MLFIAQRHSDEMAATQSMHHSTNAVFQDLPLGWLAYGENVVYGTNCDQMFEAFMGSDSHRQAMLRPDFNYSGTAISLGSDGWIYATMVFVNLPKLPEVPRVQPAPPTNVPPPAPEIPSAPAPVVPPPVAPPPPIEVAVPEIINLAPSEIEGGASSSSGDDTGSLEAADDDFEDGGEWLLPVEAPANGAGPAAESRVPQTSAYLHLLEKEPSFASSPEAAASLIEFALERAGGRPGPQPSGMS